MRICKNCHREIPDDQPFCPYCCPPDADPEDNWAFAPLGDIEYIEDTEYTGHKVSVDEMENAPDPELTETQQFNMAFDFNHVTLMGESSSKEPVNYLKAVAQAAPPSDEAARRKALDEIFNPIEKIFTRDESAADIPALAPKRTRSFKISPMKRPVKEQEVPAEPSKPIGPQPEPVTAQTDLSEGLFVEENQPEISVHAEPVSENLSTYLNKPDEPLTADKKGPGFRLDSGSDETVPEVPGTSFAFSPGGSEASDIEFTDQITDSPREQLSSAEIPEALADVISEKAGDAAAVPGEDFFFAPETEIPEPVSENDIFFAPETFSDESVQSGDISWKPETEVFSEPSASSDENPDSNDENNVFPYVPSPDISAGIPDPAFIPAEAAGDTDPLISFESSAAITAQDGVIQESPDKDGGPTPDSGDGYAETPAETENTPSGKAHRKLFKADKKSVDTEEPEHRESTIIKTSEKRLIPEDIQITPREGGKGAVEKELEELKEQHIDAEVSRPLGPAGVTVLILVIVALLVSIGFGIFRLRSAPLKEEQLLMQQIEGTWVSGVFALKDDDNRRLAEVMEIKADGTFAEKCSYVDSEENTVEEAYSIHGTVEAFIDENIILSFCYDTGDGQYYFIRELLSVTSDGMTLREYYDEEHTDSYDLVFSRYTSE